jgi:hypothetical protein
MVNTTAAMSRLDTREFQRERERVYSIALHDVRRMIEHMRPDDLLVSYIYRRLAKAIAEVYGADLPDAHSD